MPLTGNTTSFAFTNTQKLTFTAPVTGIKAKTNYAEITGTTPTSVVLANRTTPLDQDELLTYRCMDIDKVSVNPSMKIQNPSKVRNGVQYVAKLEEILRTTDADGNIIYDEPIVMYLTVRHQKTGTITEGHIATVFERLLGCLYDETNEKWRFGDLMRSAIEPTED